MGVPEQNDIWVLVLCPATKNTIRGRWWFPPSLNHGESCESMFARGSSMHKKCFNYALTNLLFGLCRFVWIIDLLFTLLLPIPKLYHAILAPEVLRVKERAPTPYPFVVFTFRLVVESTKEFGGCHPWIPWFEPLQFSNLHDFIEMNM
jgi:hypothetical protein